MVNQSENHPSSRGTCTVTSAVRLKWPCLLATWRRSSNYLATPSQSRYSSGTQQEAKGSGVSIGSTTEMRQQHSSYMMLLIKPRSIMMLSTGLRTSDKTHLKTSSWLLLETKLTYSRSRMCRFLSFNNSPESTVSNSRTSAVPSRTRGSTSYFWRLLKKLTIIEELTRKILEWAMMESSSAVRRGQGRRRPAANVEGAHGLN